MALVLLWVAIAQPASAEKLQLVVHLSSRADPQTVSREWIDTAVERANELLSPTELEVAVTRIVKDDYPANVSTRRARHSLARFAKPGVIHVFIAHDLANVDKPGLINGVHWRHKGHAAFLGRRYIILGKKARSGVLAHELGHFFGLSHSKVSGNLMSYRWGKGDPHLSREQVETVNRHRAKTLKRGFVTRQK